MEKNIKKKKEVYMHKGLPGGSVVKNPPAMREL